MRTTLGVDDLARLGSKLLEREQRVVVDAARGQHVGDRVAERGGRDGHRGVLGCEEVDLDVPPDPLPADERLGEEGGLVGGGGALVRQLRDQDRHHAFAEVREGGVDPGAAFRGVEVVGHLVEAGDRLGCEPSAQRDDERVVGEVAGRRDDDPVVEVERLGFGVRNSIPFRRSRSSGRLNWLGRRSPTICHSIDGW